MHGLCPVTAACEAHLCTAAAFSCYKCAVLHMTAESTVLVVCCVLCTGCLLAGQRARTERVEILREVKLKGTYRACRNTARG